MAEIEGEGHAEECRCRHMRPLLPLALSSPLYHCSTTSWTPPLGAPSPELSPSPDGATALATQVSASAWALAASGCDQESGGEPLMHRYWLVAAVTPSTAPVSP